MSTSHPPLRFTAWVSTGDDNRYVCGSSIKNQRLPNPKFRGNDMSGSLQTAWCLIF